MAAFALNNRPPIVVTGFAILDMSLPPGKPYLKTGGFLLANDSHGDAGFAAIDDDYQLKAVFSVRNGKHRISETNLDEYFIPKSQIQITKEYLEGLQKGVGYKKTAGVYLFQKVQ